MLTTATMASVKDGLLNARSFLSNGPGGAAGGRSLTPHAMTTMKTAAVSKVRRGISDWKVARYARRRQLWRRTEEERDAEPAEPRDLLESPSRGTEADDDSRDDRPDLSEWDRVSKVSLSFLRGNRGDLRRCTWHAR
jgi:hypothetical protein